MIPEINLARPLERDNQRKAETEFPVSKEGFQLLFLKEDQEKSVEVFETETLPCNEIVMRLKRGESVFVSKRIVYPQEEMSRRSANDPDKPWYFKRV